MSNEVSNEPVASHAPENSGATAPSAEPPVQRRWWLTWSNVFSILLIAGLTILGYFIFQGEGVFVTVDRNQNPFDDESELRSPQDISQSTIILQENFETTRGSWSFSPPNQASFYAEALLLDDNIYDGESWAQPGLTFDDFVLKTRSRWVGGALSGVYGIRIRKDRETGEFLALYLHNDGRFTIAQQNRRSLTNHVNKYNSAIKTDGSVNTIQIEASGQIIHFFVNESYLGTFSGAIPESGDVEFVATKEDDADLFRAGFDNLVITHNFVGSSIEDGDTE
ncbi:MAG: hypothetical protein ACI9EW_000667 [Cellvibrionaceae bacterium]|jgi:hypothetical protein